MFEAVKTGSGEGAVTGRSSRWRILRLPAAWWRCGIGLTRNLLVGSVMGSVEVDPMCRKRRKISSFLLTDHGVQTADHAWLRLNNGRAIAICRDGRDDEGFCPTPRKSSFQTHDRPDATRSRSVYVTDPLIPW